MEWYQKKVHYNCFMLCYVPWWIIPLGTSKKNPKQNSQNKTQPSKQQSEMSKNPKWDPMWDHMFHKDSAGIFLLVK